MSQRVYLLAHGSDKLSWECGSMRVKVSKETNKHQTKKSSATTICVIIILSSLEFSLCLTHRHNETATIKNFIKFILRKILICFIKNALKKIE